MANLLAQRIFTIYDITFKTAHIEPIFLCFIEFSLLPYHLTMLLAYIVCK